MNNKNNRIQILPHDASATIRAGQVVGSVTRALEELCRNSILHGNATDISVTIGERYYHHPTVQCRNKKPNVSSSSSKEFHIEVTDDGSGIDKDALEKYIGTDYCSSSQFCKNNTAMIIESTAKGEFLKSLACLCLEMRIVSMAVPREDRAPNGGDGGGVAYQKILKQGGCVVSFEKTNNIHHGTTWSESNRSSSCSRRSSGTTVALYGLFHNHSIRRQQYERLHHSNGTTTISSIEKWKEVHQARSCLSQLAMAFPFVTFRLLLAKAENPLLTIDTVWSIPLENTNAGNYKHWNSCPYTQKLHQLIGNNKENQVEFKNIVKQCYYTFQSIDFSNETIPGRNVYNTNVKPTRLFQGFGNTHHGFIDHQENPATSWRLVGSLAMSTNTFLDHHGESTSAAGSQNHNQTQKRIEFFFINGRPLKHNPVRNVFQTMYDCRIYIPFILHLSCPDSEVDVIIDDQHSYVSISRNQSKVEEFIQKALDDHLKKITDSMKEERREFQPNKIAIGHRVLQKSSRVIAHSAISMNNNISNSETYHQTSPFDNAFIQDQGVRDMPEFFNASNKDEFNSLERLQGSLDWTKERLRPTTNVAETSILSTGGITMDKELLSRAQFIAQVNHKFLLTNYDGTLCLIDQHAADERIGLEQLEQAVLSVVRGHSAKDSCIKLSKLGTIGLSHILQSRQLEKGVDIEITASQRLTIMAHDEMIRKWNFDFHFLDRCDGKVRVTSIPEFCGKRPATAKDFIHFVDELSDPSCLLPILQSVPKFVQRYLSSLACRYAIMFGEPLSDEKCKEIISSLSQCEMPSVCAHGRPSMISILDHSDGRWQGDIPYFRRIRLQRTE